MNIVLSPSACVLFSLRVLTIIGFISASFSANALSLQEAQQLAIQLDPWQQMSRLQEQALVADSRAAATLADPILSLGLANLPTDGFQFKQEAMTQLKVGLSQQFARGDSLEIKRRQLLTQAAKHPLLRQDRQAQLKVIVAQLWLDAFTAQQHLQVVQNSRALFVQLSDLVQASYASGQARTRQQDIIQAQLEIARLDDQIHKLLNQRDSKLASLNEWLEQPDNFNQTSLVSAAETSLGEEWPQLEQPILTTQNSLQQQDKTQLAHLLKQHPSMLALQQQVRAQLDGVELAKQQYQPQWGINASYAYRADAPNGSSRADFFSVGVSLDLPLFANTRQDSNLASARLQAEAAKTEQLLLLRNLIAQAITTWQSVSHSTERISHFQHAILPQLAEQADATINAYTTDNGDFGDVMRARITQLNTHLELINIRNHQAQSLVQLQYYFSPMQNTNEHLNPRGEHQ